jgi:hypothetical protein
MLVLASKLLPLCSKSGVTCEGDALFRSAALFGACPFSVSESDLQSKRYVALPKP